MVFSSIFFLLIFLPICLLVYYAFFFTDRELDNAHKRENLVLLIFSIIFYALGGVKYLALIFVIIFINWISGFLCVPGRHSLTCRKISLVLNTVINLSILFFFKYFNLAVSTVENIFYSQLSESGSVISNVLSLTGNGALNIPEIVLPIGISFYTFQALSYSIDVYRGACFLQPNFLSFSFYICFFPQLIAGPIVEYKDIEFQLTERFESPSLFAEGIKRFSFGLAKKVFLANTMGELVDTVWALNLNHLGFGLAWFSAISYSFQIYYDFSAYSDMAIGLGKMFGFNFKENFNLPYLAESVQDFWRRWHISLSTWFKDYVYIPLGGNRISKKRTYINIFIVFLLTGIWHGANWTFLVWGVGYGILLILERAFLGDLLKKSKLKFLNRLLTFVIVTLFWVIFRADNLLDAFTFIKRMFTDYHSEYRILHYLNGKTLLAFILCFLFSGPLQRLLPKMGSKILSSIGYIFAYILLLLSIVCLANSTYNPFIYFQF